MAHVRPNPLPYATQRLDTDFGEPRLSPYKPLTSEIQTNTLAAMVGVGIETPLAWRFPKRSSLKAVCSASGSVAKRLERGLDDRSSSPLANLA